MIGACCAQYSRVPWSVVGCPHCMYPLPHPAAAQPTPPLVGDQRVAVRGPAPTDVSFRNLTRPAVLKDAGVVIEPIRFSKAMAQHDEQVGRWA